MDEEIGVGDITGALPDICAKCKHSSFTVKTHNMYGNNVLCQSIITAVCEHRHGCNHIMEMMKRDERNDAPPQ